MVKTAASHAVNIGSNPVRVTTSKQAADHSHRAVLEIVLDKKDARQYNIVCFRAEPDDIVGAD